MRTATEWCACYTASVGEAGSIVGAMHSHTNATATSGCRPMSNPGTAYRAARVCAVDHLNYALTWAALSACTAVLAVRLLRRGAGPTARSKGHTAPPA